MPIGCTDNVYEWLWYGLNFVHCSPSRHSDKCYPGRMLILNHWLSNEPFLVTCKNPLSLSLRVRFNCVADEWWQSSTSWFFDELLWSAFVVSPLKDSTPLIWTYGSHHGKVWPLTSRRKVEERGLNGTGVRGLPISSRDRIETDGVRCPPQGAQSITGRAGTSKAWWDGNTVTQTTRVLIKFSLSLSSASML